ncbi:hypothetical protein CTN00_01525 [Fusobacterium pseudoperiodonticum]|uniref:DUF6612 family protein n=1 Tax=Fusobacterium pseudoperiodonticum TaxID=2663009 RepID=UPI000C1C3F85|nr:DUF6612 family protein [Fusobacterium pseudoperiodonticum]ATV71765.1 hypothetical protein CTN00_01525 [Fusobacterium pseudoperiodonticum]
MKKSFKKILFTIFTVFAVFFIVACGNKEDTKINKEEVLKKAAEVANDIKSGNKLVNTIMEIKGGVTAEYIIDSSIIIEPFSMKLTLEQKGQDAKVTTFVKDGIMYMSNPVDNTWEKQAATFETIVSFKNALDTSTEIYNMLKDHLDKVDIKEKDGNYVISVPKNSDFIKESLKEQMNSIVGQSPDFNPDNVTFEYLIDKETYFPKVLSLSFEAKLDEQDVKVTTTNTLSNINSVGEITVPEEALNSNN